VSANIGRFGPYVRYGDKFVSIRGDDPYTIDLPRALELVAEKKILDANRIIQDFPDAGIQVLNGRYGPYVTDGKKNAKIPKDVEPAKLTLDECEALVAAAPERRGRRGAKKAGGKKKPAATKRAAASKKTPSKKGARKKAKKTPAKKTGNKNAPAKKRRKKKSTGQTANAPVDNPVGAPIEDS
jgi:DNA topoisomerase-1